ncbi:MAG TPA: helix-turn-helix domain-containing protein [Actinospica sp.]|nr:helix-turn-helix domain-containing protein [Actinospica sp.]
MSDYEASGTLATAAGGRSVLEGAFALLEALQRAGDAGLTRLAAESGLPKATAHRLLDQLVGLGAVARSGGRYRLGSQMFRLGRGWSPVPGLREAAKAPSLELARATGATVAICALHDGQPMAVSGISGEVEQLVPLRSGQLWPWRTAAGRLLVAGLPANTPLGALPAGWRRERAAILERAVVFDHEEVVAGVVCVAVPLNGPDGGMVAALTVLATPERRLPGLADAVVRAGRTVSARLRR